MDFASEILQFRFEFRNPIMPLGNDQGLDVFEYDRLAGGAVLHVDGGAIGAIKARIGDYADAQPMEVCYHGVADIAVNGFPGEQALDTERDIAPVSRKLFCDAEAD